MDIVDVLCGIDDRDVMSEFLDEILTANERKDLGLRWQSLELLSEGLAQRKISERLGISLCKITRGSKVLKKEGSVSKRLLDRR
jgi:TrpR family trp operon transcriptional repressor